MKDVVEGHPSGNSQSGNSQLHRIAKLGRIEVSVYSGTLLSEVENDFETSEALLATVSESVNKVRTSNQMQYCYNPPLTLIQSAELHQTQRSGRREEDGVVPEGEGKMCILRKGHRLPSIQVHHARKVAKPTQTGHRPFLVPRRGYAAR